MQAYLRHIHRSDKEWICPECGKIIRGKANTYHLGVISNWRKYRRENNESIIWRGYFLPRLLIK